MIIDKLQALKRDHAPDPILDSRNARMVLALGDTLAAKERFIRSVEAMPSLPRSWYNLAVIAYRHEKNHTDAFLYLKRVLTLEPNYQPSLTLLVDIIEGLDDSEKGEYIGFYEAYNSIDIPMTGRNYQKFTRWYGYETLRQGATIPLWLPEELEALQ